MDGKTTEECQIFNKGPVTFAMVEHKQALKITFGDKSAYVFSAKDYGIGRDVGDFKRVDTPVAVDFFRTVFINDAADATGAAYGALDPEHTRFCSPRNVGRWWRGVADKNKAEMQGYPTLRFYFDQCEGRGGKKRGGRVPTRGDIRNFRIIWKEVFKKMASLTESVTFDS